MGTQSEGRVLPPENKRCAADGCDRVYVAEAIGLCRKHYGCGHICCDERDDPLHDHFLRPVDCPSCRSSHPPLPADKGS